MSTASDIAIFGAGPAGLGPLVCAGQRGDLHALLQRGVSVFEASATIGAGSLGGYAIDSDTRASVLLECLDSPGAANFARLSASEVSREVRRYGGGPLPLPVAGRFLAELGATARQWLDTAPRANLVTTARLESIQLGTERHVARLRVGDAEVEHVFRAGVLALGGEQPFDAQLDEPYCGGPSLRALGLAARCVSSDSLLRGPVPPLPRAATVAVLGGSHSALASASHLLSVVPERLGPASIQILARRMPKVFYPTAEAARAERYPFGTDDVCRKTGRVFRLAGLRFSGRELLRGVLGVGGESEDRVTIARLDTLSRDAILGVLRAADAIVVAHGYRPRTVPFYRDGHEVPIGGTGGVPLVDDDCALLDASGERVPRMAAIGLASGFVPSGDLGGEPSFSGNTNGLWLYQNGVGARVLARVLEG